VALLPVFFLLPISVAFTERPALAAVVGIFTAVGYLGVWIVYSKRDETVELPSVVYTHFGLLLWLAAAMTALCYFLTRAATRVAALLDMRRTLVAEAMRADERHSRALAEQLHDGPLQDLLAARLELDEVRERHSDPRLDAAYQAVQDTATRLRSTVTALHPHVLTEVGLTAAVRELIRDYEHRGNFAIEARARRGRQATVTVLAVSGGPRIAGQRAQARAGEHRAGPSGPSGRRDNAERRRGRNRVRSRHPASVCRRRAHRTRVAGGSH
jgi:two-component system NarL family sensor kinase